MSSDPTDALCADFVSAWESGQRPLIAAFPGQIAETLQPKLPRRLISLDIEYRLKAGDDIVAADYRPLGDDAISLAGMAIAELTAEDSSPGIPKPPFSGRMGQEAGVTVIGQPASPDKAAEAECPDEFTATGTPYSHIGPYRLLQRIGQGGMDVVSAMMHESPADDPECRRCVAEPDALLMSAGEDQTTD